MAANPALADLELTADEQKALQGEEAADTPRDEDGRFVAPIEGDAPAEEAATEPEAGAEPVKAAKPPRMVPLSALEQERRELKAKIDERDKTIERGNARLEQLFARFAAPKEAEQPKPPDLESDPLAVVREIRQNVGEIQRRQQLQDAQRQFEAHVSSSVAQYKQGVPDYDSAYSYARQHRAAELKAMGLSDEQIPTQIAADEAQIALTALQQRRNPGDVIYNIAKARGYAGPAAQDQGASSSGGQQRLDTVAQGQRAARSLGAAGGAPPAKLSLESLANMSEAEFAGLSADQVARILGG